MAENFWTYLIVVMFGLTLVTNAIDKAGDSVARAVCMAAHTAPCDWVLMPREKPND